ncbi:MAG: chromate efflux transporter [Natronospirillum sp.]
MTQSHAGSVREVFTAFLWLGLTSFGGPVAHLGYFRTEFVQRRQWLDEQSYADLVALCQFLPGPASSQVGFALGQFRAGALGAAAAWIAFTLPSALLLVLFALGATWMTGPLGVGLVHGLKIVAVAIVAHAVWGMARNLCPDKPRAAIALLAVFTVFLVHGTLGQVSAIAVGALLGWWWCRDYVEQAHTQTGVSLGRPAAVVSLVLVSGLLGALPVLAALSDNLGIALFDAFYRTGALVFGGGHVVLPLLQAEVVQPGWVSADAFLAGYSAAQAVPGPLFSFSAYLGWVSAGAWGAAVALVAVFLPGFLLLLAVLPFWNQFRQWATVQSVMRGANAAVVGLLAAALYDPVWTSAIVGPFDFALALLGFLLLTLWRVSPLWVVGILTSGGLLIHWFAG